VCEGMEGMPLFWSGHVCVLSQVISSSLLSLESVEERGEVRWSTMLTAIVSFVCPGWDESEERV